MSTSSSRRPRQPPRPRKPPTAAQRERGDTRLYNPAADCPPLQLRTSGGEAAAALRSELCPLLLAKGRNHSSVRFEPQLRWPLPRSSWAPMCHKRPGFYGLCFAGVPRASTLFLARALGNSFSQYFMVRGIAAVARLPFLDPRPGFCKRRLIPDDQGV
ncbi:hypothetical protein EMIHUDRAFT_230710 [Emiliania huxleyi CCMP1516]|uniref:Uncharacterized protein n=2 Tax=Emiliania huxleyi TaxID=2903 RepID=A0A0D3K288_EMIH1|nr:hypothetical protein EMIHUDRAFT_233450 [Emiliania huxleyi CCMP1516]XP_005784988.1 hypothetical protein EMIHUDRAFT_230710 [Emiliania huxleyi CCMP1516]EOD29873.1 hypothetical protein EMIHUDRAFT_233450 [Emiliania huxleyi CCMP1516]EOD32559.1 hypothetical protein EMIHUDRAFT_230710 [Emiliania huxleyi CCMP1516]|eukprot:XP_005782302.1 hypothetical protein EMIHUDRAFT_233450 [Emiliania huxleyi CCMP1516]